MEKTEARLGVLQLEVDALTKSEQDWKAKALAALAELEKSKQSTPDLQQQVERLAEENEKMKQEQLRLEVKYRGDMSAMAKVLCRVRVGKLSSLALSWQRERFSARSAHTRSWHSCPFLVALTRTLSC